MQEEMGLSPLPHRGCWVGIPVSRTMLKRKRKAGISGYLKRSRIAPGKSGSLVLGGVSDGVSPWGGAQGKICKRSLMQATHGQGQEHLSHSEKLGERHTPHPYQD